MTIQAGLCQTWSGPKLLVFSRTGLIILLFLGGRTIKNTDYEKSIPIQRVGTKEDIANTVLYIVSPAAQLLTGTTIIADGGAWLTSENSVSRLRRVMELNAKL